MRIEDAVALGEDLNRGPGDPESVTVSVGMGLPYGPHLTEPSVELRLSPRSINLRLRAVSRVAAKAFPVGLPSDVSIDRGQVKTITRGLMGRLTIEHRSSGAPSPIWVGTAADNGRLAGLFESMGYVIDDRLRLSQTSQRALLGLVLLLDLGLLVGLVVAPGVWVFVLLPVMWVVTLLWALPRLR